MNKTAMPAAGSRQRLPNRRYSENRKMFWKERTIYLSVGYGPDGLAPKEVFYADGYRSGSDMEALVSDLCIAVSVMLQHDGVTAATLRKSMGVAFDQRTGDPMPASILGLLLEELSRPPEWADAVAQAECAAPAASMETGISGAGALDRPSSGEAGRRGTPGPEEATRRQPVGRGPGRPASGEER